MDLCETVNFKFENENSVETLKKMKYNTEIANHLYETVNFKFEKG